MIKWTCSAQQPYAEEVSKAVLVIPDSTYNSRTLKRGFRLCTAGIGTIQNGSDHRLQKREKAKKAQEYNTSMLN